MDSNNTSSTKVDVYQIVTDRIIALLEQGTVPWQQPWTEAGIPMNLLSKRPYRGINLWLLLSLNYERNLFLTWDQLKKIGASVNNGESGHVVIYWKTSSKINADSNGKQLSMLRYYKVWNISQCRDLPDGAVEPFVQKGHDPIPECEAIITGMPQCPPIKHKEPKAYYDVEQDCINMPKKKSFTTVEDYYSVLFHELVHSTGSEKRLKRKSVIEMAEFNTDMYSIEELVSELGAAYLSADTGIIKERRASSVGYIQGWLGKLRNDKKFVVHASGFAQKAVDFILNQQGAINDSQESKSSEIVTEE